MKETKPRAPKHLRPAMKTWWTSVVRNFQLEDHHRLLLTAACEALDRAEQAREAILHDGPYFSDRHGAIKPHPGLQTERDSKALFARFVRELDLDAEAPGEAKRPPALPRYERR